MSQTKEVVPAKKESSTKRIEFSNGVVDVRRRGNDLRSFKAQIALYEKDGNLVKVMGKPVITVQGYRVLNKMAGINVINAPELPVDGKMQMNPFVERNPRTRAVESVAVRKLGIGYSPTGNLVVVDSTVHFNIYTYFLQSLFNKVQDTHGDNRPGYAVGISSFCPFDRDARLVSVNESADVHAISQSGDKYFIFKQIEPGEGMWIDPTHKEIEACYKEHIQRQKFGDRLASSICERNVLKSHPAIATQQVELQGEKNLYAIVEVFGWQSEFDSFDKIKAAAMDAVNGESGSVEVIKTEATVIDPDDVESATDDVADIGDIPETQKPFQSNTEKPEFNQSPTVDLIYNAAKIRGIGVSEFLKSEYRLKNLEFVDEPKLKEILEHIESIPMDK